VRRIGPVAAPCEPQVIQEGARGPSFVRRGLAPSCEGFDSGGLAPSRQSVDR
jgi:hypothetical protein